LVDKAVHRLWMKAFICEFQNKDFPSY